MLSDSLGRLTQGRSLANTQLSTHDNKQQFSTQSIQSSSVMAKLQYKPFPLCSFSRRCLPYPFSALCPMPAPWPRAPRSSHMLRKRQGRKNNLGPTPSKSAVTWFVVKLRAWKEATEVWPSLQQLVAPLWHQRTRKHVNSSVKLQSLGAKAAKHRCTVTLCRAI